MNLSFLPSPFTFCNFCSFSRIFACIFLQQTLHFPFNRTRLPSAFPPLSVIPATHSPPPLHPPLHRLYSSLLWRADKRAEKVLNLMATPKNAVTATGRGMQRGAGGCGGGARRRFQVHFGQTAVTPCSSRKKRKKEMRRAQKQNKILKRNSPISAGRRCRPPLHAWPHARRAFCLLCCSCSPCA